MPVNCPKCSRPILVTDVIESFDRRLSHLDCARPNGLRPEERALIFVYCSGHPSPIARLVMLASASPNWPQTFLADGRTYVHDAEPILPRVCAGISLPAWRCLPKTRSG